GTMPGRVDLGFFPPSSDCSAGYWNSTTDGTTLLANALESVSGGVFAISTFCDPANVNSTGLPAQMTGNLNSGSGSGLHLECSQGPSTQFGYFLVGTGSADPGTPLSQGRLCLALTAGNQFGRYNGVGGGGNSVGQFDGAGIFQNLVGSSAVGSGFDVPSALPTIGGTIQAGETWHFQLWYREAAGQSNFSNGLTVQF
ncbi:MAG TPA: hypothetical protein P5218_07815, partial [Planctomycetota bacterium]|nr:hypothetical protein [Planctomycetota bacterium]